MENRAQDAPLYYLSRGQLAIVVSGFAVASLVVFLLGVLVGQRIEERKLLKKEDSLVKLPVEPLAREASAEARSKDEITFYETLAKTPREAASAPREPGKEPAPAKPVRKEAGDRPWTVQVYASRQESDASQVAGKLKARGYDAYVVSAEVQGKAWHRVRVGRFETRDEARRLLETLKARENLAKAIVVR